MKSPKPELINRQFKYLKEKEIDANLDQITRKKRGLKNTLGFLRIDY